MSTDAFENELRAAVGTENVLADEPLRNHTTFRIGGPAQWLVLPASEEDVAAVVALCRREGVPLRILGAGSNVLAPDEGLGGVTLKLAENLAGVDVLPGALVRAAAGATNEAVAAVARDAGLAGYEFACGIPGTIGGAAIMNAGAYEGQFSDVAVEVHCVMPAQDAAALGAVPNEDSTSTVAPDGSNEHERGADVSREWIIADVPAAEAAWGYRKSRMMDEGWIVLGATLQLRPDSPAAIAERMADLTRRREEKQPLEMPSAGSTFKRPEGHFAGKLIQDAGLQGTSVGGAQVSIKHAGFVVNTGNATAADVLALVRLVQERVRQDAGVQLEPEVRLWK